MATLVAVTSEALSVITAGPEESSEQFVYLHGWGGSKELWWNVLNDLSDAVRGIALDLPGTGSTPMPDDIATMSDMARWVAQTCTQMGLHSVTLVGHSLGGNLAVQVALEYPQLVRRLVLVDAALETGSLPRRSQWPLAPKYGMTALRLARLAAMPLAAAGARVPDNHRGGYWLPYARRMRLYLAANSDEAMQRQLRALVDNPLDANRLRSIHIPILIVHGAFDAIIPVARARALAHALPEAKFVVFPTAHHCPMDADPDLFAFVLRDFIDSEIA